MDSPDGETTEHSKEAEFMRLFVRHEPVLRAYARSLLPNWNAIDDALQEASVTMWQKLGQLEHHDGFLPWAKVILRYKCLQMIERLRRDRPLLSDEVLKLIAAEAEETTLGEFTELRTALGHCLDQFSKTHQELLLAPYRGAGRVRLLADQAGKSANSLYKLLGRLREKLTVCVQGRVGAEGV
ncbi:MAG: sigma-70 family RNA polymerase sigma factor [Planctomycetota bacterium]